MLSGKRRLDGKCAGCDESMPPRWQELVWDKIKDNVPVPSISDNHVLGSPGCMADKTRPDWCWIGSDRIVHLECDENSHLDRDVSCELRKNDSAGWGQDVSLAHLPTVIVRFNPSKYDKSSITLEERCRVLVETLNDLFTCDVNKFSFLQTNIIFMYYHSKASRYIEACRDAVHSLRVLDVITSHD